MSVKFPTQSGVCRDCEKGLHVLHVISELGDLEVTEEIRPQDLKRSVLTKYLKISGWAEDELFLEDLLRVVSWEYQRMKPSCGACRIEAAIGTQEVPHPVDRRLHTCVDQCFGTNAKSNMRCERPSHHPGLHSCTKDTVFEWSDAACHTLDPPPKELK